MNWIIPLVMGAWAAWTWSHDQEKNREEAHAKMAALYVNPFLSACEDLQSRIYNILELGGLSSLREHFLGGEHAEETLYLVVRYFGWLSTITRYGPYTQDPVVIRLAEGARRAFATTDSACPAGPFNFSHTEQKALGKMVMTRFRGQHGIELDTISYYEFSDLLALPPLTESKSIQRSLEALRNADEAENLIGQERLREAQYHLVDLLNYLEREEGFSLFPGVRKRCMSSEAQQRTAHPLREVSVRSSA